MKRITAAWLCVMLVLSMVFIWTPVRETAGYTISTPFRIDSNANLGTYASGGDGSLGNPWIIEDYEIDGTDQGYCIYIGNVTDHFIVRNCYLHNASNMWNPPEFPNGALVLNNTQNGDVYSNIMENSTYGIYIHNQPPGGIDNHLNITNNSACFNIRAAYTWSMPMLSMYRATMHHSMVMASGSTSAKEILHTAISCGRTASISRAICWSTGIPIPSPLPTW